MGQDWFLMNLDKRQGRWVPKLGEVLFSDDPWNYMEEFMPAPSVHIGLGPPAKNATVDVRTSLNSSILSRLSPELYHMIFESLKNYFDCICLGLTCRLLWSVARPHVQKRYVEDALGSWAGDRIICVGAGSKRDDPLPPGVLTEQEEKEWKAPLPTEGCRCGGEHEPDELADNLYFWAGCAFTDEMTPAKVRSKLEQRAEHDSWRRHFDWDDRGLLKSVVDIPQKPVVQDVKLARPLILRNLSRELYVREDVIDQFMDENQHLLSRFEDGIGLGHVILMRVCWSSDEDAAMDDPLRIHRGPWAGDRFDFVSARDFRAMESGDNDQAAEWTDATAEAVRDIKLLWEEARRVWS